MAKTIMVQGTASNAGKSVLTAALCRILRQDGYRVAPFKAQNMALNSFITADGLEIGRAQAMQAEAAGILPDSRMNPVLLKPTSDQGSQLIVNGRVRGNRTAQEFYRDKAALRPLILEAFQSLAAEHDVIVLEGAGSPAEINLKADDLVNMGMAEMARAPVLLVGDIDRGGVFASLYGTLALLTERERSLVRGLIINKFRGDVDILRPGLNEIERLTKKPVLGVVPYTPLNLDEEDSLSDKLGYRKACAPVTVAVPRFPRISNFTDLDPFDRIEGVSVEYVTRPDQLAGADLIVLAGSKSTLSDLKWLRESGLAAQILKEASRGTPVFGICGGYQMMGRHLQDPFGVEGGGEMDGLNLLPIDTVFAQDKVTRQTAGRFGAVSGALSALSGIDCTGFEIHMGQSERHGGAPLLTLDGGAEEGCTQANCCGTYLHGVFDCDAVAGAVARALLEKKGLSVDAVRAVDTAAYKNTQYDKLADTVRGALDMDAVYRIMEEGI